ncbi:MAG TPA: aldehyde dehydrogenase (NADP(+)) [Edaphobacter sp.]|nr:aldehyde dehydrogenase (NADP(+)) [Edaphobacter sp.]
MAAVETSLSGFSLVGDQVASPGGKSFSGVNPATGQKIEPAFYAATEEQIQQAVELARESFFAFSKLPGKVRGAFLRKIADAITAQGEAIVERANLETGLPLPRLQGELARTTNQLKLFAEVLEEGSWVDARIDEADAGRKPLPKPDVRSMSKPLGPVAVFGASNFPLAFSVAGGDTASALAAGCPVVVKAHPAHPGTSELVGRAIQKAVKESGLPGGVFSLLFDAGVEVGVSLVKHPEIKAVAFTGSQQGGKALMKLAADRPEPIPCYAEMGSTNPLFILPGAMKERGEALAQGLQTSFTLGSGQFCTKPGLVFTPPKTGEFTNLLQKGVNGLGQQGMLTPGIAGKYKAGVEERKKDGQAELIAGAETKVNAEVAAGAATIFEASLDKFLADHSLEEEIFGPTTLLVEYGEVDDLVKVAEKLHGHLTATIHGTDEDIAKAGKLIRVLEEKVGRILFNGYPTGVEVCHAMVHGGPYPATSDTRTTSVGTKAIHRFVRPVCYQDCPDAALPEELRKGNPLGIMRLVNGSLTRG